MAKNEKDEAKKVGEAIFNKYAKDAEAEHMSEIEQMLKDAGVDMDSLAEEGDDEEEEVWCSAEKSREADKLNIFFFLFLL